MSLNLNVERAWYILENKKLKDEIITALVLGPYTLGEAKKEINRMEEELRTEGWTESRNGIRSFHKGVFEAVYCLRNRSEIIDYDFGQQGF